MLAGCTALHSASYHRQYGQLHMNVPPTPPSQPSSPLSYGLLDHLFQYQHEPDGVQQHERIRSYECFAGAMSFPHYSCEGDAAMDNIGEGVGHLQKRSSNNELFKLVDPFLTAEQRAGTPCKNLNSSWREGYDREVAAVSLNKVSELEAFTKQGQPANPMTELPCVSTHKRLQEQITEKSPKDVLQLREKKEWALCSSSWSDGGGAAAEKIPERRSIAGYQEELQPWQLLTDNEVAKDGCALPVSAECLQRLWKENNDQQVSQATPASSMSSAQNDIREGANLGGGRGAGRDVATASMRGSCSPSSVALSAESPSNSVPSSSTVMLSPPLSSTSIMVQRHESPVTGMDASPSGGLLLTSSRNNNRIARELCYGDRGSDMSPLSLPVPKCISFSGLPPAGRYYSASLGLPSLVQQQCLSKVEQDQEAQCTELVDLLVACVEAISAGGLAFINQLLARLGKLASPGGSSMHRLAAYFTEGLACRVSKMWPHIYQPLLPLMGFPEGKQGTGMRSRSSEGQDAISAWQVLNSATPFVKFSHFTANEMILQAFEGEDRVHVIDLDIKQGLQWPALFQSLSTRRGGPPQKVRVTGIGECKEEVQDAGDRLAELAEEVGLKLEFHAVVDKLEDVRLWMLHVKSEPREAVAVNCIVQLHQALHDESGDAVRNLLTLIHSTRPKVVALVEQEVDCHDQPSLEARFSNALRYFAAVFDAIDASLPGSIPARYKVESYFGASIRNILACDGSQRMERYQPFRRWQRLFVPAGFRCIPLSQRSRLQAQILLRMFASPAASSYRLLPRSPAADECHLTLAWLDHPLFTASAWTTSP